METLVRRLRRILSSKKLKGMTVVRKALRPSSSDGMQRLQKALTAYVENQGWREPVRTVGEAAERLGTDTHTLHRYFQERVGVDFRTWRTRLRLEDAKRLLSETPALQPAVAARLCGFSNRSNFSRQFLAYTGLTPAQWQKEAGMSHDIPAPENDYV
jgi:AraC-like DNA-binding protein